MDKLQETDLILNPDGSIYHLNLRPEHLSDLIIAVGDPDRVSQVTKYFDKIEFEINKREFITHVGFFNKQRVTVISSGIGTDNVEILLCELDALANIDLQTREVKKEKRRLNIIRIGTSGSLQSDLPVGTHLVNDYGVGLDNLMNFYVLKMGDLEAEIAAGIQKTLDLPFVPYVVQGSEVLKSQYGIDMISGNTVTCPGFYAPQGRFLRLPVKFPGLLAGLRRYYHQKADFRLTNFEMETSAYYALGRLMGHEILSVNAIIANRVNGEFSKDPGRVVDELVKKILSRI